MPPIIANGLAETLEVSDKNSFMSRTKIRHVTYFNGLKADELNGEVDITLNPAKITKMNRP